MKNETAIEITGAPLEPVNTSRMVAKHEDFTIEQTIRYAIEQKSSVEVMQQLMSMRRELQGERSKEEFDSALADFQSECPIVQKRKKVMNKDGRSVRYLYAPLDDIVLQVKAILQKHGFSYSLDTLIDGPAVKAICKITHSAGHSQLSSFQVPIDPEAYMTDQQKFASALTFAKRYAFCNAFGILTGDEDTDGAGNKEKPTGPSNLQPENPSLKELAKELWDSLKNVRGPEKNWEIANRFMRDELIMNDNETAPHFTAERFQLVIAKAKATLAKQGK